MLAIDTRARGSAMAICALVATLALADAETKGSPTDLEWLRDEVGDGALIHHSDGRIYLTELATAESVLVGNGNQPESIGYRTRKSPSYCAGRTASVGFACPWPGRPPRSRS